MHASASVKIREGVQLDLINGTTRRQSPNMQKARRLNTNGVLVRVQIDNGEHQKISTIFDLVRRGCVWGGIQCGKKHRWIYLGVSGND